MQFDNVGDGLAFIEEAGKEPLSVEGLIVSRERREEAALKPESFRRSGCASDEQPVELQRGFRRGTETPPRRFDLVVKAPEFRSSWFACVEAVTLINPSRRFREAAH